MIGCLIKGIGRCGMLRKKLIAGGNGLGKMNNRMAFSQVAFVSTITHSQDNYNSKQSSGQQQLYTERAYTPSQMSQQLIHTLTLTKSQQQILHQLSLYSNKLLPFDYDYFTESLRRLIPYQGKLSIEEILMLFDLAIEYKIDSLVLEKQFVNELYCRVYAGMNKELMQYDRYVNGLVGETYKQFQALSKDHFDIISDQFKEQLEQQAKQENQQQNQLNQPQTQEHQQRQKLTTFTTTSKPIYNSIIRKKKSKHLSQEMLNRITKIFVDYNCKHIQFNKLLLEIHTIRLDEGLVKKEKLQEMSAQGLLLYARLTVNLLQLYMIEYQSTLATSKNKDNKYTHRSVKNIYKLQNFYYYEVAKMIEDKHLLTTATNEQLLQFVHVLSSFPIKRRSFRKSVGDAMIGEFKRRELEFQQMIKFFELSKYDNKLLHHFENKINKDKQLLQSNKNKSNEDNLENDNKSQQALIADLIIDTTESHEQNQSSIFNMPLTLFKKVTKKKSKPKNKKPEENEVEIDLTQPQEEGTEINSENKQVKLQNTQ